MDFRLALMIISMTLTAGTPANATEDLWHRSVSEVLKRSGISEASLADPIWQRFPVDSLDAPMHVKKILCETMNYEQVGQLLSCSVLQFLRVPGLGKKGVEKL